MEKTYALKKALENMQWELDAVYRATSGKILRSGADDDFIIQALVDLNAARAAALKKADQIIRMLEA